MVKNPPALQKTRVWSLSWEDPLEEEMATDSSILPRKPRGQRSVMGCSPGGRQESDTTEWLTHIILYNTKKWKKCCWVKLTKSLVSEAAQSCLTPCNSMGCSLPCSSIHGVFHARVLEWVAISFSRGSSPHRGGTWISRIVGRRFTIWATRESTCKTH